MVRLAYLAWLLFLLVFGGFPAWSASHFQIRNVRFGWHEVHARLVLDLREDIDYRLMSGSDPRRILVAFPSQVGLPPQRVWPATNPLIREVRFRQDREEVVAEIRLVSPGHVQRLFRLSSPGRLVVDIARDAMPQSKRPSASAPSASRTASAEGATVSAQRLSASRLPTPSSGVSPATPAPERLLAATVGLRQPPPPQEARKPDQISLRNVTPSGQRNPEEPIYFSFKDADILQIINLMSELTGKSFLVDDKVKGKVTIVTPRPVSLEEAYQVFLSILEIKGFTVVPQGPVVKILPAQGIKQLPLPTAIDGPESASDAFITQLIPLEFADANEVRNLLSALVSRESSLLAYPPTNTLILTENAANIVRMLTIIRALDIETTSVTYKVIPLRYALAEEMASSLQTAMGSLAHAGGPREEIAVPAPAAKDEAPKPLTVTVSPTSRTPRPPTKILAETRTNSLVVIASPGDMAVVEDLLSRLDVPTPEGQGQIHVYYLSHIDAVELAQVLTEQTAEIASLTEDRKAQQAGAARRATQTGGVVSSGKGTGSTSTGISITAHKPTNSLIITASPDAYALMKGIIEKLDIRRAQVLVESLIAEVQFDQTEAFGVEWRLFDSPNGDTQAFGSSLGTGEGSLLNAVTANPLTAPPGLVIGVIEGTININGQEVFDIPAVLRAVQSNADVNVLAMPNLLTTDNEEAKIVIGEERPFLTASTSTPAGGVISTTRNFEFRDTGITLRVKPKISQGRTVHLDLFLEITNFAGEAETGAVTTTKRSAETSIILDDGQTIVVGGIIRDDNTQTVSSVPCLGNAPLFGWLFRQTSDRNRKTNLLIFLTPHVLTTAEDADRITEHKRRQSKKAEQIKKKLQESQPLNNLELLLN